jgi:single-stranded DNA-binding protein
MATTITGKLNKAANQFQAGESTGFGIRLGVQYYDRETKEKAWTNYECAIFAKNPNQISFLQTNLVEGAVVEVTGQQEKIKVFEGQNGQSISIELIDANLGFIHSGQQPQPQQPPAQQPQQQNYQQPQQPQQPQTPPGYNPNQPQGYDRNGPNF